MQPRKHRCTSGSVIQAWWTSVSIRIESFNRNARVVGPIAVFEDTYHLRNIWNLRNIHLLQNIKEVEAPHPPPGYSSLSNAQFNNLSVIRNERPETSDRGRQRVRDDVYLIAEQKELGGRNRYVADGFLNSTECEFLMQLATVRNCNPVVRLDWTAVIRMFF